MKLSKETLRRIILEEIEADEVKTAAGAAEEETPGGKQKSDVTRILQFLDKIDNPVEYSQMLTAVIEHAKKQKAVPAVKKVLIALRLELPDFIKGL